MRIPRLLIAGTHSGAGKTSVAAALMAAYSSMDYTVLPFKAGPDYIDPAFHSFITGCPSHNLDTWLLPNDAVHNIFRQAAGKIPGSNTAPLLAIIEGVMGLFDGQGSSHEGSSAQLAQMLGAPVILVLDAKGLSRSAAAMVQGYDNFLPGLKLAGVICNRVSGSRHYDLLRDIIENQAGVPCLGYLPANPAFGLESRHLGLVPAEEVVDLRERINHMALAAKEHIDLERLFSLAETVAPLPSPEEFPAVPAVPSPEKKHAAANKGEPLRIGLARDAAFSFYYQANLDLMETMGAALVPFSPLDDAKLPENLHGLYLGGGFPEQFAAQLAANTDMRSAIRGALETGLPCYAECGGMLYLTQSLRVPATGCGQDESENAPACAGVHPMVGFFPCRSAMGTRLQHFGYVTVSLEKDCILGRAGASFRAHEFHYSYLEWDETSPTEDSATVPEVFFPVYGVRKADGRNWPGGLVKKNTLGAYPHIHFYSNPDMAAHFIDACRMHAERSGPAGSRGIL